MHTCTPTHACSYTHIHTHAQAHASKHMYSRSYTQIHTRTPTHTYSYTYDLWNCPQPYHINCCTSLLALFSTQRCLIGWRYDVSVCSHPLERTPLLPSSPRPHHFEQFAVHRRRSINAVFLDWRTPCTDWGSGSSQLMNFILWSKDLRCKKNKPSLTCLRNSTF